jgi:Rps23 Pro-64 3,4-dihydroxylase Tpa1-like proline 4-hydroxylase
MINIYSNFLSEECVKSLDNKIEEILYKSDSNVPNFTTSLTSWAKNVQNSSTPIIRYVLNKNDDTIFQLLKKEIESKIPYYVDNMVIHLAPKLSYIPWHNDSHASAALTIYLNKKWDINWGGYFLYKLNSEIKAIKPEFNLGILQEGGEKGLPHCVTTTNIDADLRISLQLFLTNKKKLV